MAQEDDLRALGKIMDFLRAVSIILAIMNHCCPVKILKYHLSSNSRNSVLDIQALI